MNEYLGESTPPNEKPYGECRLDGVFLFLVGSELS